VGFQRHEQRTVLLESLGRQRGYSWLLSRVFVDPGGFAQIMRLERGRLTEGREGAREFERRQNRVETRKTTHKSLDSARFKLYNSHIGNIALYADCVR
jgi:hypothetical protein